MKHVYAMQRADGAVKIGISQTRRGSVMTPANNTDHAPSPPRPMSTREIVGGVLFLSGGLGLIISTLLGIWLWEGFGAALWPLLASAFLLLAGLSVSMLAQIEANRAVALREEARRRAYEEKLEKMKKLKAEFAPLPEGQRLIMIRNALEAWEELGRPEL